MNDEVQRPALERLLSQAGVRRADGPPALTRLAGGANNRVYLVEAGRRRAVLKVYFADRRPRLRAEYSFLRYARECGVEWVPKPLAQDEQTRMALYEFVAGRRMSVRDLNDLAVERAAAVFARINAQRDRAQRFEFPPAAEACFSIAEHVGLLEQRVGLLAELRPADEIDELAAAFIADRLRPAWTRIRASLEAEAARLGLELSEPIATSERCVSPSDFGFHNALIDDRGRVSFIDFEYAGWDDPAKLVCDFFNQVEVPVPRAHRARFEQLVLTPFPDPDAIRARIALLFPAYTVKWACIVLNEFLARGRARRDYALGGGADPERRRRQLDKAAAVLASSSL